MKSTLRLFTLFFTISIFVITMNSCVQTKEIVYFQGDSTRYISMIVPKPPIKTIQPKDILAVLVTSLSEESNTIYNSPNIAALTYSNFSVNPGVGRAQPAGYIVDSLGYIGMPLIGRVKVKDLTLNAASDTITKRLTTFLKEPSANIRILNHKFSVLGEVARPGVYNLIEDRVSVPEALGMAGDLTIFAKRDNILLIRERESGKRELIRLDLRGRDILSSPYYYLEQNDVLYVEPLKTKATATDQNYQLVPIFTGIVSALGILILNLRN